MRPYFYLFTSALVTCAFASPSSKREAEEVDNILGCGSKGPLSGAWAMGLFPCETDDLYVCQATDLTGCSLGDNTNIESLTITDMESMVTLGSSSSNAEATFQCPTSGLVQCAVRFTDDGALASDYGMRVLNITTSSGKTSSTTDESLETDTANTSDTTDTTSLLDSTDTAFATGPTDTSLTPDSTDIDTDFSSSTSSDLNPTDDSFGVDSSSTTATGTAADSPGFTSSGTSTAFGTLSTGTIGDNGDGF